MQTKRIKEEKNQMTRSSSQTGSMHPFFVALLTLSVLILNASVAEGISCKDLLEASASRSRALRVQKDHLTALNRLNPDDPIWPLQMFLCGEVLRLRGETSDALKSYRSVSEWAAKDPYRDGRGGSGIAIIALWRWLGIVREQIVSGSELTHLVEIYETLKNVPLSNGMLHPPKHGSFLSTLPQIQEAIPREIAYLAHHLGQKEVAGKYFLEYLQVASSSALDPVGRRIMREIPSSEISRDQVSLLWAKRLYALKKYDESLDILRRLTNSRDTRVRPEAALYQAKIMRKRRAPRSEITALLTSAYHGTADAELAQKALYERALVNIRRGAEKDTKAYERDLLQLIREFPSGQLHDDALYQLAQYHQNKGEMADALTYYRHLRNFRGKNDRIDSAHFYPAMTLYGKGGNQRIKEGVEILRELMRKRPAGPMRFNTQFWLGRFSEETGKSDPAERYFRQIIADAPFHYYAVRARMHLNMGNRAKYRLRPDKKTRSELRNAFRESFVDRNVSPSSAYHHRIKESLDTGLYKAALDAEKRIQRAFPTDRIEYLSLKRLDNRIAGLGVLLSLRQDALTAKQINASSANMFQIAGSIGSTAGDWPFVMTMVMLAGEYYEEGNAPQRDRRYLATAYPAVFRNAVRKESSRYKVPPEMVYSMMRRESRFSPTALSKSAAFGLFQFMPRTFQVLDSRWNLLESSGTRSREEFLADPVRSVSLGARWCSQELLRRYERYGERDILFAIMDHNAGSPSVREWIENWKRQGFDRDIEYMIETTRYGQTRIFTRRVLGDMFVSGAGGLF